MAGFRNRLTHFYREVASEELYGIVARELDDVAAVAVELRRAATHAAETGVQEGERDASRRQTSEITPPRPAPR